MYESISFPSNANDWPVVYHANGTVMIMNKEIALYHEVDSSTWQPLESRNPDDIPIQEGYEYSTFTGPKRTILRRKKNDQSRTNRSLEGNAG